MNTSEKLISKSKRTDGGCWEYQGYQDRGGYCHIFYKGKERRVHRVAWMTWRGPIPDGLFVLHHCDNPRCINPKHLFLGTDADNAHDKISKGRAVNLKGEDHGNAKLTSQQVSEIRMSGLPQRVTASIYGVSKTEVGRIRRREYWRVIP
jgi:hypothetical protein